MSENIGFHKGSIQTLMGEKAELLKMISTVDQLIQAHNNALKEFNIDYIEELKEQAQSYKEDSKKQQKFPSLPKKENKSKKEETYPEEDYYEDEDRYA